MSITEGTMGKFLYKISRATSRKINIYKEFREKWNTFINNQKDIPSEYVKIINDNFWDLLA